MCGIAGIAVLGQGPPPEYERLKAMCDTIRHRGPDDEGLEIKDGVALGMRRLAIIDLSGGRQPIANEDGSVRTVFNGEIYNFRELRRDLESRGHQFRTQSDTEVIVHGYEAYGEYFPNKFNGMFAFALHDMKNRKLVLARDHIGIKPFYYAIRGNCLVWGSEIKAILASGLTGRSLDVDALGEFLAWEYVPGEKTLFQGIFQIPPGAMLEADLATGTWKIRTYWDVPHEENRNIKTAAEWEEAVDAKLREAVRRQLVSDVPLGAFLSGGVDSSLVVAAMDNAKTFSIGFDDPGYNELAWAQKAAAHLGATHKDDIIRPDITALFDQLMFHMDDPIGDFSIFPTWLVSRHARQAVTVSLSGDGGDELFGGYETYVADEMARQYARIPKALRQAFVEFPVQQMKPRPAKKGLVNKALRFVEGMNEPEALGHARWRIFAGERMREILFTPEAKRELTTPSGSHILKLFAAAGDREPLNRNLYVDLKSYLCDNCLVKVDRMSMAVSLEARVPFLDRELVEMAFQIPARLKVSGRKTKILLKRVAARHIPAECVYRPKEGFSIPIKNWLGGELRPMMEELLDPAHVRREGIFSSDEVERLKREHLAGVANHSHVIWSLMVFQAWKRKWLEG